VHGKIAHAQKRNLSSNMDDILYVGRHPRPNYLCKFWWRSVKRYGDGGGQIWLFSLHVPSRRRE